MIICCACEEYGGDPLACSRASGGIAVTVPCGCDCHKATHEAVSLPKGRLAWLERCERAIQSMAAQQTVLHLTPEQLVADVLRD